ncbi:unnamed protein product [Adineta steineri]|uniref:Uncharacterized protein n=1 Tax=Adineta steineri TaxID=433720 RepID=A0A814AG31_9BILA|nr:unnamed protein product [Adineta steineri]CAF1055922.1 unnamed protein product [Adineta steineri]CAF1127253.1 unnamed protein product [Adineta steineri]
MRWYCWFIFFAIASLSISGFPANENADENNLLAIETENDKQEDIAIEKGLLNEEEEDDDDDDELIDEDDIWSITDRHLRQQKGKGKQEKGKGKDKHDSSSSEENDKHNGKHGKKGKKTRCICFGKKNRHHSKKRPHQPMKHHSGPSKDHDNKRPSSPSQHGGPQQHGSSSQRPQGQGNKDQNGCKTVICNFVSSVKNVLSTFTANGNKHP